MPIFLFRTGCKVKESELAYAAVKVRRKIARSDSMSGANSGFRRWRDLAANRVWYVDNFAYRSIKPDRAGKIDSLPAWGLTANLSNKFMPSNNKAGERMPLQSFLV